MILFIIALTILLLITNMVFYEYRVKKQEQDRDLLKEYSKLLLKRKYK